MPRLISDRTRDAEKAHRDRPTRPRLEWHLHPEIGRGQYATATRDARLGKNLGVALPSFLSAAHNAVETIIKLSPEPRSPATKVSAMVTRKSRAAHLSAVGKISMVAVPCLLFLINAGLILWKVRAAYFVSVPLLQYAGLVWGAITGLVTVVSAVPPVFRIAKALLIGKEEQAHQPISLDRVVLGFTRAITTWFHHPRNSVAATIVFTIVGVTAWSLIPIPGRLPRTSSAVLTVTSGQDTVIYVADADHGQVLVFRSTDLQSPASIIPIGTHGNLPGRGRPEALLELRRGHLHLVLVTDTAADKVHIINEDTNSEIGPGLAVGRAPRALAITPDHRKLFVSNEQPIPSGSITVFDVSGSDVSHFHLVSTIASVNCPEGLVVSPQGERLYVASQCGGGADPVFVINTATDKVVGSIPGLAVGTSVAIDPRGRSLYVSRGNQPCTNARTGEIGSPLSRVDLETLKVTATACLRTSVGAIAISHDLEGRYLFVANGTRLSVFDRRSFAADAAPLNDIPLEAGVLGIGIADDNSVYAYLPSARRLFLYSPAGL